MFNNIEKVSKRLVKNINKLLKNFNKAKVQDKLFVIIIAAMIVIILYKFMGKMCRPFLLTEKFVSEDVPSAARPLHGGSNNKTLLLVHWDKCGHCKKLMHSSIDVSDNKGPWFKAKKNNKTEIKMDELEQGTKEGTDLCKKYNIGGFPTILLLDNQGKPTMDSNGDVQNVEARSTDELLAFLNNSKM
jgi:thioredoxin-related protein